MLEKLIDEPNWDGLHVCMECGIGISKLTAESYRGRCVPCFNETGDKNVRKNKK